ncbi:MAG: IS200/IS605 family element transposase accessory protein TnpB [Chloroflexi bacterium]|nr:IS200/IS605 family element transposase accessory protein TnpB [Chloroflexota bacterium]
MRLTGEQIYATIALVHKTTFQYRLYPTSHQETILRDTLEECRWVFNETLAIRKKTWEEKKKTLSNYDTHNLLTKWKKTRPSLKNVHSQVLQNVQERVDLAFMAFFRRVKTGDKEVGYPRFRGKGRYDSFTYPQSGFKLNGDVLYLSKIGDVRVVLHRQVDGRVKTCTIRRTPTNKWFVTFSCEIKPKPLKPNSIQVGIDVGLNQFATLSTGETIENPRFFRRDEKYLVKYQSKRDRAVKGSPQRRKFAKIVRHIHERIANRRKDFVHQQSRRIINRFGFIAVEDIQSSQMLHNHCLAKSISDVAWGDFLAKLSYKAEYAGRNLVRVNPAYTSQDCSRCGHRQLLKLSDRQYNCPCCGLSIDRDLNASLNILARGRTAWVSNP